MLKQIILDVGISLSRLSPLRLCALLVILVGVPASAHAAVVVTVDKSAQRMSVAVDGTSRHNWAVSTGRAGYGTPSGTYAPTRLERTWFSRAYYNSPMPHSIFFHGGYAIHGSYEISRLGGPASHGCIRLHPSNAATLFSLVRRYGAGNTRIIVTEGDFGSARRAVSTDPRAYSPYQPRYQRDYAPRAYPGPGFPFYRY